MKLNCWPGCLAYVIFADYPENIGAVVEVLSRAVEEGEFGRGVLWACQPLSPMGGWALDDGEFIPPNMDITGILDVDLRPITPPAGTVAESEVSALYQPSPEFAESTEFAESNFHLADGGREPVHGSEGRTA